jgi:glycosyltransferase involved in cell wall biosynthesis
LSIKALNERETMEEREEIISIIGTLPPIKGISPYCSELALMLAENKHVDFINFKKLYPERLYPGGTKCEDLYPVDLNHRNLSVRNIITWYNPLSWIRAGFSVKGSKVLAQWWSYPLAPVYLIILSIAKLRGKEIHITVHNIYPHERSRVKDFLNHMVLPLADTLIVHTEDNRKELVRKGWKEEKIKVLPHPPLKMSGKEDAKKIDRGHARNELGFSQNDKVLCFFGNIRDYKGLDNLLLALAQLRQIMPEIRLIIAGQPWGNWDKYERIIREEKLERFVTKKTYFLPFDELARCLKASDLVVFPFKEIHSASSSLSLALGMGCNILCTRKIDAGDDRRVFYVDDSNPQALMEGIWDYFLYRENGPNM